MWSPYQSSNSQMHSNFELFGANISIWTFITRKVQTYKNSVLIIHLLVSCGYVNIRNWKFWETSLLFMNLRFKWVIAVFEFLSFDSQEASTYQNWSVNGIQFFCNCFLQLFPRISVFFSTTRQTKNSNSRKASSQGRDAKEILKLGDLSFDLPFAVFKTKLDVFSFEKLENINTDVSCSILTRCMRPVCRR